MPLYLRNQLAHAQRMGFLPRCDHGRSLMDWSGEQLEPPCGCRLDEAGMVSVAETAPVPGRVSTYDLTERLGHSLVWIDLRTKIVTMLHEQSDKGDMRARDQLDYVTRVWPGGGAPRSQEFAVVEQLVRNLQDLVVQSLEAVMALGGDRPVSLIEQARTYGVDLPSHIKDS